MLKEPLALIGMSCRLPGGDGLDEFWNLVVQGATAWGSLPADRLNRDLYFAPDKGTVGKSYSELGGLVSGRSVDQSVCPLTAEQANHYDIAHQVFLEVASRACRDAGLDPFAMPKDSKTGVYVGHTGGSARVGDYVYSTRIDEAAHILEHVDVARKLLGDDAVARVAEEVTVAVRQRYPGRQAGRPVTLSALDAARLVREALKLEGPYLVVDAACASSLQALAVAARALNAGSIDQAIVGGASYCKSDSLVLFSAAQSVSNKGSCPFGKNADGLVAAEGYVALVLKTLSRAMEDGDRIRAVIRGIGVASDGKGKSLWAPRQEGQTLAVQRAYPKKEDLSELEYIEAHATSTQVGDATELGALAGLLSQHIPSEKKVPIGSVKANVGHTLETAGLASLVKVVLAMEHNVIPPGTTADEFNDEFDWKNGPFRVPKSTERWKPRGDGKPRLAAVNAFGIGGLNVHLAISEHVEKVTTVRPVSTGKWLVRDEPIAIVGTGCVLPGALSVSEFEKMLAEGRSAIQAVLPERWSLERAVDPTGPSSWHTVAGLGGFVEGFAYDWRRHKVPPKQIAAANPLQFMLLEAADAALAGAGLNDETWDRTRVSVVVGTMFGGDFSNDLQIGLRLPETAMILTEILHRHGLKNSQINDVLSAYEKKVLERFPALVDETGSFTSSTLASRLTKSFDLKGGALALDAGDCSSTTAIAAAVDMLRDGSSDAVLCAAGQRYLDLVAYEILSLRGSLASHPRTALDLDGEGRVPGEGAVVLVMKRLADAQAAGDKIHGVIRDVSVSAGEQPEVTATRVMSHVSEAAQISNEAIVTSEYSGVAHPERDRKVLQSLASSGESEVSHPVSSLDGTIGHLGAAAGAAGVLKLMNAVRTGNLPAANVIEEGGAITGRLRVSANPCPLPVASTSGYRAGSLTEVNEDLVGHLVLDNGLSPTKQRKNSSFMSPQPQSNAQEKLSEGSIAALFPGQGSQYTGMFQGLATETPEGRVVLEELDELARACQAPTLSEVAWKTPNKMGSGVWETQWSMYLGDLFAWKVLTSMGFRPGCIASHSFGEFPALTAAGSWSEVIGFQATKARAKAVEQHGPVDGAMLSILADAEAVKSAIKPFESLVWRCAENAPEQTVVGGTSRAIDAVELLLEPTRARVKRLAVPSPFHTPLLRKAAAELSQTLDLLPITESQYPVLSSTTLDVLSTPAMVRTSLVRQMTETVRWVEVVKQLYQAGARTFVEVGPGAVLSGLVRRILADCRDITIVQFDQRGRTSAEQMARLQDALSLSSYATQTRSAAEPSKGSKLLDSKLPGDVFRFDATARRRERNRDAAAGHAKKQTTKPVIKAGVSPSQNGNQTSRFDYIASVKNSRRSSGTPDTNVFSKTNGLAATMVDVPSALSQQKSRSTPPAVPTAEVEDVKKFLIEFVIEQTGYPREIVELDADLEADLGIDSIRKAQLFGEIGQKYDLEVDDELSLDDFPTLRHLLEYMQPRIGGGASGGGASVEQPTPSVKSNGQVHGSSLNGHAHKEVVQAAAVAGSAEKNDELSNFLIEFVIEQTGYPREIVELDADLEADLGIDSIRKAQLFGEIGQKYDLEVDDELSLDDFPTLRHLLEYMQPRIGGGASGGGASVEQPTPSVKSNGQVHGSSLNGHAHKEVVQAAAVAGSAEKIDELSNFLIEFVIEQTGYPREIVELDADLEADLGIDSIRKAQLFGEIGQKYDLEVDDELSLDDFPTLRHLLEYMQPRIGGGDVVRSSHEEQAISSGTESIDVYRSPAFLLGEERGRRDKARIQQWGRVISSSLSFQDAPIFPREIGEELDGVATGAAVSSSVVRAAMARPSDALGTIDVIASIRPEGAGVIVGFGRHVAPHGESFTNGDVRGGTLSVPGLPGTLCGWNQNGLVSWIDRFGMSSKGDAHSLTPAAIAVDHVVRTACSIADATDQLRQMYPLDAPIFLLCVGEQQICRVSVDGNVTVLANEVSAVGPQSPLARIALHDGQKKIHEAVNALVGSADEERARISATSYWVALEVCGGKADMCSGGPTAAWCSELSDSLRSLRLLQSEIRPSPKAPVRDQKTTSVTRRYVVDHCEIAAAVGDRQISGERVLVLGSGSIAEAVAAEVRQRGADAVVVSCEGEREAKQLVEQQESVGALTHLVIASAAGESSAGTYGDLQILLESVFFTCQQWIIKRSGSGDIRDATLTAVTRLGGQFGIDTHIDDVAGGGLAGLFKNIAREFPDLQVRVVDHAREARPSEIAHSTVTELCTQEDLVEVGYRAGMRVQMVSKEAAVPEETTPLEAVSRGAVWLVTGGARGVTAACARAFGKQYELRLALVGSTELVTVEPAWLDLDDSGIKALKGRLMVEAKQRGEDPRRAWKVVEKTIEIRQSLAAFDAEGIEAHYFPCDLSNEKMVQQMVADVQQQVGPVRGIVHGAGFEAACRFEKKTHAGFCATVGPKALGLEYLLAATDETMLGAVVGFGSTSGRFGGHGQADYAMANDILAKIVGRVRADRNIPATVFHWHAWDEVGMASRPESRFVLEQFGLKFMPLAEGVQHFLDEIAAGLPATEVVVTESAFCEAAGCVLSEETSKPSTSAGSLIRHVQPTAEGASVSVDFDPTQDKFLVEHTQYGRPLLPAVMAAELIAQSALAAGATHTVREIRNVMIQRPFGFSTDTKREATITVGQKNSSGEVPVIGWAAVQNTAGHHLGDPREHFSGSIVVDSQGAIENVLDEQLFPFNPMVYQEDAPLRHGQSFRTLSGLFLDRSGGWGRVTAPDPHVVAAPRGAHGWTVPIALLDGCLVGCAVYSYILLGKRVEVPLRFERLRFADTAHENEKCTLRMFYRSHDKKESIYDFTLYGSDNRPIFALDGLHLARVPSRQEP